jgi:hypothetical protein
MRACAARLAPAPREFRGPRRRRRPGTVRCSAPRRRTGPARAPSTAPHVYPRGPRPPSRRYAEQPRTRRRGLEPALSYRAREALMPTPRSCTRSTGPAHACPRPSPDSTHSIALDAAASTSGPRPRTGTAAAPPGRAELYTPVCSTRLSALCACLLSKCLSAVRACLLYAPVCSTRLSALRARLRPPSPLHPAVTARPASSRPIAVILDHFHITTGGGPPGPEESVSGAGPPSVPTAAAPARAARHTPH